MHTVNSAGRRVSLLNDEPMARHASPESQALAPRPIIYSASSSLSSSPLAIIRSNSTTSARSSHSSSASSFTPDLVRADSFDSNLPHSPVTPTYFPDFSRDHPYAGTGYAQDQPHYDYGDQHHRNSLLYAESRRYEEEKYQRTVAIAAAAAAAAAMPPGVKRYPCRYKDSHGCEKTFTTSGHASRHSKIHTAEKAVSCTWKGCQKKFTRADNMKQHLETHTKERSRPSSLLPKSSSSSSSSSNSSSNNSSNSSSCAVKTSSGSLTMHAGVRKASASTTKGPSRPLSRNTMSKSMPSPELPPPLALDPALLYPFANTCSTCSSSTCSTSSSTCSTSSSTCSTSSSTSSSSYTAAASPSSPHTTTATTTPTPPSQSREHLSYTRPMAARHASPQAGLEALALAADFQAR